METNQTTRERNHQRKMKDPVLTSQNADTSGNSPQDTQQAPASPRYFSRASRRTQFELLKQAEGVAELAAAGRSPGSPEVKQQARLLLRAAVAWQESAVQASLAAGEEPRSRPAFQNGPKPPDLKAQPGPKKYHSRIFLFASRYAWDKRDGLDARESARNLVLTAYVGFQKKTAEEAQVAS